MGESAAQIKARLRKQFGLTQEDIDAVRPKEEPLDKRGADMYRDPKEEELAEELKGKKKPKAQGTGDRARQLVDEIRRARQMRYGGRMK